MSCRYICPATLESFFDSCIEIPINHYYPADSAKLVTFDYSSLLTSQTGAKSQVIDISSMPANQIKSVDDSENNPTEKSTFLQMLQGKI